ERARDAEEQSPRSVEGEPAAPPRERFGHPRPSGDHGMGNRGDDQDRATRGVGSDYIGQRRRDERDDHQRGDHRIQSLSVVSWSVSMSSNSRLMWKTVMPITNTATKRSSSTPSSTSIGVPSTTPTPNT